ncbi:phosphonates metabolism transcriptional regulator PhnF [Synechococcus sp. PCC 7335]|uniref:phosphonate metabolism transcriptional regulator PhnF n=1 Tax=Synechococcus sp. (strain ATCC 29403 / PCC 7335) TaxID=91464 RepID=UPI00017EB152|nr:phosphonate metabolism transcriptional regulator PhnF [Synechococcus sp. PCC 7335]EDX87312.1 phosphonates metabolism transcriptional regulator PhnF [Synechococcus sp. PCC 7335]
MIHSAAPLYVQIAQQLRNNIQAGVYKVGDRLPPESQLSQQFSVNRNTIRQAISLLKQEGLLRSQRGSGTFVAAPIRYAIGQRVRYNEALKAQGHSAAFTLIRAVEVSADVSVAKKLSIEQGAPVAHVERLGTADDEPISVGSGYFPLARFPDLLSEESISYLVEVGSISRWLRDRYAIDHIRLSTSVSARLVQPRDAKMLELPLNQAILLAESVNADQQGRLIEYGVARLRGDRMEMVFDNVAKASKATHD